jgi:putative hydrolase
MSLLEGHAEVVMDAVGPEVVPGVDEIRRRFAARRRPRNLADRLLRAALGLEQKMRQYTDGATFVRTIVAAKGMSGFNDIWRGPEALPSAEEILNPELWLQRAA